MHTEKLSISIPYNLIEFIEDYRKNHTFKSKSQVVQQALKLLQEQELEAYYLQANAEIDPAFDNATHDGLDHETW